MAQLGQKAHGFKDLDFLMVLGFAAVVLGDEFFLRLREGVPQGIVQRRKSLIRRLPQGHAAACQTGASHGARTAGAGPRRAAERPRPDQVLMHRVHVVICAKRKFGNLTRS
jgi:hypothetical protein